MNNNLFNEKAKRFRSKPQYIKAAKYEEGMENGWYLSWEIVSHQYYAAYSNYYEEKLFDTKNEALNYIKTHPTTIIDGISYINKFKKPLPCLIKKIPVKVEGKICWEDDEYEILNENSWLVQWEGCNEIYVWSKETIEQDWILDK